MSLELSREGKTPVNTASGEDCWQGPWQTGLWLAQFAHQQGVELKPGQVIICGALGKIVRAESGNYLYDAGSLGRMKFSIVP